VAAVIFSVPSTSSSLLFSSSMSCRRSTGAFSEYGHEPEVEDIATPVSTWWGHRVPPSRPWMEPSKRKRAALLNRRKRRFILVSYVDCLHLFLVLTCTRKARHRCHQWRPRYNYARWARSALCFVGVDLAHFIPVLVGRSVER
jgi:hypothetical protein